MPVTFIGTDRGSERGTQMLRKKNKVVAFGEILEKRWARDLSYRYRYKVKVRNVQEPMVMLYYHYRPFEVGDTVTVEYDPDKPKRCKLIKDYD